MKSVLRTLHRWCGLVTAVFLIISGVTGSLLAFEHELDAWLNPELFYTGNSQSVQPVQPALAANRLIEQIEANEPRIRVSQLPLDAEPGSAIEVQVEPRMPQSPTGFNRLWVDPATGRILGHRTWGVWQGDRAHFMPWLNRFHRSLTLPGRIGHQLLGAVAMAWLAMSLTGLYLTLPARIKRKASATQAAPHYWSRWRPAWRIQWKARGFRWVNDLHRATGLWLLAIALCSAFTGVYLNLGNEVFKPVVSWFGSITAHPLTTLPASVQPRPPALINPEQSIELARALLPEGARGYVPWYVSHLPTRSAYRVAFKENGFREHAFRSGYEQIFIDDQTGQLLAQTGYESGTPADRFLIWMYPIHSGKLLGLSGRVLIAVSGVLLALLCGAGLVRFWMRRQLGQQQRGQPRKAGQPS